MLKTPLNRHCNALIKQSRCPHQPLLLVPQHWTGIGLVLLLVFVFNLFELSLKLCFRIIFIFIFIVIIIVVGVVGFSWQQPRWRRRRHPRIHGRLGRALVQIITHKLVCLVIRRQATSDAPQKMAAAGEE